MNDFATLSVREALDRVGLTLFPNHWTGKEYRDHWRLGLRVWPPTKLRGMAAERELLRLVADGLVTVEVETTPGECATLAPADVRHFHGTRSMVAGSDEVYRPCRLRFPAACVKPSGAARGRKPFDYPGAVVRITRYLDSRGCDESVDRVTHTIIAQIEREGGKAPHYSKLQPYVSAIVSDRREQHFPECNSGNNACDQGPY